MRCQLFCISRLSAKFGKFTATILLACTAPLFTGNIGRVDNFAERTLAAHNRERVTMGIAALQWDEDLARDAAEWAAHLTKVGYLVHYPDNPYDRDPQGENLWAGTAGYYGVESMVGLWVAEKKDFKPGIFPENSRTGNLEDIGHYTQLVWRNTRKVGCAIARGRSDEFMVCRYSEGGNVMGERPF